MSAARPSCCSRRRRWRSRWSWSASCRTPSRGGSATESRLILADNYRSVLAAQRMKEALERIDSDALVHAGRPQQDAAARHRAPPRDLRERARACRRATSPSRARRRSRHGCAWPGTTTSARIDDVPAAGHAASSASASTSATVEPAFSARQAVRGRDPGASTRTRWCARATGPPPRAQRFERVVIAAVVLGADHRAARLHLADRRARCGRWASSPRAVRRFGEGDLRARADVRGEDEIAAVAAEFNRMAERLERYRASSLGELLAGAAGGAGGDRRPPRSGAAARRDRARCKARTPRRHGCSASTRSAPATEVYAGVDPGVRAVVDRLRVHVLGGKGPYVPEGLRGGVACRQHARGRAHLPAARDAASTARRAR